MNNSKVSKHPLSLDNITTEQYRQLVELISTWISIGKVRPVFYPNKWITLQFDDENINSELKKNNLPSNCFGQLKTDIPLMLFGILSGYRNAIANMLSQNASIPTFKGVEKPTKNDIRKEVTTRIDIVEKILVSPEIRREYAIKSTAQTSTYLGISWDITEKKGGSAGKVLPGMTYATIQIAVSKPGFREEESGFFLPIPIRVNREGYDIQTLALTIRDIEDIISNLEKMKVLLREASNKTGIQ